MAIQTLFSGNFDNSNVTLAVTFDDVALILEQLQYHNATPQAAALALSGVVNTVIPLPANVTTNVDLSADHITVVATQVTNPKTGLLMTVYNLLGNELLSLRWPG